MISLKREMDWIDFVLLFILNPLFIQEFICKGAGEMFYFGSGARNVHIANMNFFDFFPFVVSFLWATEFQGQDPWSALWRIAVVGVVPQILCSDVFKDRLGWWTRKTLLVLLMLVALVFAEVLTGAKISWSLILASLFDIFGNLKSYLLNIEFRLFAFLVVKIFYYFGLFSFYYEFGQDALKEYWSKSLLIRALEKIQEYIKWALEKIQEYKKKAGRRARRRPVPLVELQEQDYLPVASRLRARSTRRE
jgi:hypothetical protein